MSWHIPTAPNLQPEPVMRRCLGCPYPGLILASEMSQHVAAHHQEYAFKCKPCQESFMDLDFDKLVEHSRVEHGITILSFLSKTLVFPVQIYHYLCRACGFVSLSKELFDMHMKSHGNFFIKEKYWTFQCRFCDVNGDLQYVVNHIEVHHSLFAPKPVLKEITNSSSQNGIKKPDEQKSTLAHMIIKTEPVNPFPEIDIVYEATVPAPPVHCMKRKISEDSPSLQKNVSSTKKRKNRSQGSKSSSLESGEASSSLNDSSSSNSRSNQKSRSRRSRSRSSTTSSSSSRSQSKQRASSRLSPGRYSERRSKSPQGRARHRDIRSPSPYFQNRPSYYHNRDHSPYYGRSPSPYYSKSPDRRSPSPYYRRSPSYYDDTYHKRSHPRRSPYSPSRRSPYSPPRRSPYSPPRRPPYNYLREHTQSPSYKSHPDKNTTKYYYQHDDRRENSSSSKKSPNVGGMKVMEETDELIRYGNGEYKCKICGVMVWCASRIEFEQHQQSMRHKAALNGGKRREKSVEIQDVHESQFRKNCADCEMSFNCKEEYYKHRIAKTCHDKIKGNVTKVHNNNGSFYCHSCDDRFESKKKLLIHSEKLHGSLIKCKECISNSYTPAQVLTCQDLIKHIHDDHHKTVKEYDLKHFGVIKNWKSGYVRCTLCPIDLGAPGFWFTNEIKVQKLREHFQDFHPSESDKPQDFLHKIEIGCQLCSVKLDGTKGSTWENHLPSHEEEDDHLENFGHTDKMKPCSYCGDQVVSTGDAEQTHIKENHALKTFSCKLCFQSERYHYQNLEDVQKHLQSKHFGKDVTNLKNVLFPGRKDILTALAWVKCKLCDFTGIGLGDEIRKHQHLKHNGGGLEKYFILCRLCDKAYDPNIAHFHDERDFEDHIKYSNTHREIYKMLSN